MPGEHPLYQIDELFTKEECEELIARANSIKTAEVHEHNKSWHPSDSDGKYDRGIMVDSALADRLWEKLKPVLGESYQNYRLVEINDHFRYSRYYSSGGFPIHCDRKNFSLCRSENLEYALESMFTLNIFLNDDFEGGATEFFSKTREGSLDLRASLEPAPGRAALFYADQPHRGCVVEPGDRTKYLLRTDIMGMLIE